MSEGGRVHIIGAGLAGLGAAVALAKTGSKVALYEAAPYAGGRCRSYFDRELGCRLDNGNHLLLAGNLAAARYLQAIGATDSLTGPDRPIFPFVDLDSGENWNLHLNRGRLPWWILSPSRRPPETRAVDYLAPLKLATATFEDRVTDRLDRANPAFHRLWEPFAVAALNTEAAEGSAQLLWRVMRESFGGGGRACLPLVPKVGLSETFVDPALTFLRRFGTEIRFGSRLRVLGIADTRVTTLDFGNETISLTPDDVVILAVTAPVAAELLPGVVVPDRFSAILNAHYRAAPPEGTPLFLGLVGGLAQWVFIKRDVISVTVSAADSVIDRPADELAATLWSDVARALHLQSTALPPWRVVKERRATFVASPDQLRKRPGPRTAWSNLFLAGDWTDSGLPATIEGALRSGVTAAARIRSEVAPLVQRPHRGNEV